MQKIVPCLWFNNEAEDAAKFYTELFPKSKITRVSQYGEVSAKVSGQKKGSAMMVEFELAGRNFSGLNGGPHFKFTQGISLYVSCESEEEIDHLWKKLSPGGSVMFELKKYPWSEKYGWCTDKYGVHWQLNLSPDAKQKVIPAFLFVEKLLGRGQESIDFYTSHFHGSKIIQIHKNPETNNVMHAHFSLGDDEFILMEGEGKHKIEITPAISFITNCDSQKEIDQHWDALAKSGEPGPCGWVKDKFGVSWQVVPSKMGKMMTDPDSRRSDRVMTEVLKMKKLDLNKLETAWER